jgi:hypothetical protein
VAKNRLRQPVEHARLVSRCDEKPKNIRHAQKITGPRAVAVNLP